MRTNRAGIYARISKDATREALGVERQRKQCAKLCADRGWIVAKVYIDNDVSASTGRRRPQYEEMLEDIRIGSIDAVVVWDLDRLTRRPIEIEHFIDLAEQYGVALGSVGGDVDLSTDNGRMFARIKGAVARAEVERKGARQSAAFRQGAEMGRARTGPRPFGYNRDGKLRKSESQEVANAYDALLAGASLGSIVRDVNDRHVKTSLGKTWSNTQLRAVLLRARNAGLCTYRGEIVSKGEWEPLVSEDVWRAAVAILTDPSRKTSPGFGRLWVGSGVYRCGVCGATMCSAGTAYRAADGTRRRIVYRCSTRKHVARYAEPVDTLVRSVVVGYLSTPAARQLLLDDDLPDFAELELEARALRQRLDGLSTLFAEGTLNEVGVRRESEKLRTKLAEVESRQAHRSRGPLLSDLVTADDVAAVWDGLPLSRKQSVLDELFTITIHPEQVRGARRFNPDLVTVEPRP